MKTFDAYINSTRKASIDFTGAAGRLGTSVSSAVWAVEEGNTVTLSGDVLSSNIAQVSLICSSRTGCNLIRCVATMANGEVLPEYFKLNVIDPTC